MKGIRLTDFIVETIRSAFKETFLDQDQLWLFGSRTDLSRRGGDIDLYIESSIKDAQQIVKARSRFLGKLYMALGEQKIDVVINFDDTDLPIYQVARTEGVRLV